MPIISGVWSLPGAKEINQDAHLLDLQKDLFAVADGLGGGEGGEIAAQLAVNGLTELYPFDSFIKALEELQRKVLRESIAILGGPEMGTTLTAISLHGKHMRLGHTGDSRCYLHRAGSLKCLTRDHERFDEDRGAYILDSFLGMPEDWGPVQIHESNIDLEVNDGIFLCTDGIYRQIEHADLLQQLDFGANDPERLTQAIAQLAVENSDRSDNVTALYLRVVS